MTIEGLLTSHAADVVLKGSVNEVRIGELGTRLLKRTGDQLINGSVKVSNQMLNVLGGVDVGGFVNGINVSSDIVTKNTTQIITGTL